MAFVLVVVGLTVIGTRVGPVSGTSTTPTGVAFTDPTNHFSAIYRDKPTETDQSTTVNGRRINQALWTDSIDNSTSEIVGYTNFAADFTIADPHNALDSSVNGEVTNTHGSLVSKTFGTYQGFQSVDAVISASGDYLETRAVLAGRTLYIVVVTSTNNPPELFSGFANSLHVLNHAA